MLENFLRYLKLPFVGISFLYGSRRMRKWMKKNDKMQDPNYHDYNKRWKYITKKSSKIIKALGVRITEVNPDYKPKGSFLLIANHTSNLDATILISTLGEKSPATSIAKISLSESRVKGYMQASESFYVYPKNPRKSLVTFNKAGEWAKKNNRGIVIFPEGKRNWDSKMSEFSSASFKLAHRNYLPIHVVSIVGVLEGLKWYKFKFNEIKVIYHKPIKANESLKLSTAILSQKTQEIIQKDLDKYYESMSESKLKTIQEYQEKRRKKQDKFELKSKNKNDKSKEK